MPPRCTITTKRSSVAGAREREARQLRTGNRETRADAFQHGAAIELVACSPPHELR